MAQQPSARAWGRAASAALWLTAVSCAHAPERPPAVPPPSGSATAALPDTRPGRALDGLLRAINGGDPAGIAAFAAASYDQGYLDQSAGIPRAVQRWMEISRIYGPLVVDSATLASEHEVRAWVRGSLTRAWLDFRVVTDSAPPHRVVRVGLGRGVRPPFTALRRPAVTPDQLAGHLDAYLRRLAAADYFSGVILVSRAGRTVYEGAYGFADREARIANRAETRFDLASVGKLFTAVAVLQLTAQGKLALDDPVSRHLPGLPRAVGDRITIRHLLEHSSGLGEIGPALDSAMALTRTVPEMVALLTDTTLSFAPGSSFAYSNRGYLLLGAVVESASGRDYFEYVAEEIFARAGMAGSGFFPRDTVVSDRAARYTFYPELRGGFVAGPRTRTTVGLDWRGGPAGGAYSTARDLARFVAALQDGRLLPPESFATMVLRRGDHPWGLGFALTGAAGSFGHAGGAPGATAHLWVYPEAQATVVVLSNYDAAANLVGDYVRDVLGQ